MLPTQIGSIINYHSLVGFIGEDITVFLNHIYNKTFDLNHGGTVFKDWDFSGLLMAECKTRDYYSNKVEFCIGPLYSGI